MNKGFYEFVTCCELRVVPRHSLEDARASLGTRCRLSRGIASRILELRSVQSAGWPVVVMGVELPVLYHRKLYVQYIIMYNRFQLSYIFCKYIPDKDKLIGFRGKI